MEKDIIHQIFKDKYLLKRILSFVSYIHHRLRVKTYKYKYLQSDWITRNQYIKVLIDKLQHDPSFKFDQQSLRNFCFINHDIQLLQLLISKYSNLLVKQIDGSKGDGGTVSTIKLFNKPAFYVFDDCCISGSIDIIKYLTEQHYVASVDALNNAAKYGHLELVMYLDQYRSEGCTKEAMDEAATHNHMNILLYLSSHRKEGCSRKAMDGAAKNGYIDIVRYLHEKRKEGCTKEAMDGAARNGHLDIVKYLQDNRTEGCTKDAMDGAARNGHLEILMYLLEKRRKEGCTVAAMNGACENGHIEVAQFLFQNNLGRCDTSALDKAAENGHLKIVQFLLTTVYNHYLNHQDTLNGPIYFSGSTAMDHAIANGHMDIVRYLHHHSPIPTYCTSTGVDFAVKNGYLHAVKYAVKHLHGYISDDAYYYCVAFDHFDILEFLLNKYPKIIQQRHISNITNINPYEVEDEVQSGGESHSHSHSYEEEESIESISEDEEEEDTMDQEQQQIDEDQEQQEQEASNNYTRFEKKYQSRYGYLSLEAILKAHKDHLKQLDLERQERDEMSRQIYSKHYIGFTNSKK